MDQERQLLEQYVAAKRRYQAAKEEYEAAEKAMKIKEQIIVGMLIEKGATHTTKYEGFGFASLRKLEVKTASVPKPNEPEFFKFVEAEGHGDIVKLGIHPTTLRSFVKTMLEEEKDLPPYLFYQTQQKITFYDRSK